MAKRKLPKVGIFDPNLSQDPQFGNVHDLPDSWKRIHFHFSGDIEQFVDKKQYERFQIVFPECNVPKISTKHIDSVERISVPVIKNFSVQFTEGSGLHKLVGLFEADSLNTGPFQQINGQSGTRTIPFDRYQEALFVLNKPISYYIYDGESKSFNKISNLAQRGYVCLQNYLNLFFVVADIIDRSAGQVAFNAYIDYEVCDTTYKEALIWQADFEKFITHKLKYGVDISDNSLVVLGRGTMQRSSSDDPSKFAPYVKTSELFKVQTRDVETAAIGTKEAVWAETMKKYYN